MKKNKLLIVIILIGFLTFGMSYNNTIKENFVAPFIRQVTEIEKKIVTKTASQKSKTVSAEEQTSVNSMPVAATLSITNAVAVNGGGNAAPGSQLDFTITINNTGTDATGTTFQDILDANLTLVPNSLKVTPIAVNDAYNSIGNVGITLSAVEGVLANDVSPDGTVVTVAVLANPAHGVVVLASNGSFTYNPTAGYSGADSFTYTLTNAIGKTSTATVNIVVSSPIFFINSSAATNGTGTLQSPFKLVQNATSVLTGSNPIFIYTGAASSGTALSLSNNQKVIGQGATTSLVTLLNLTVPSYSNVLPATAGTNPTFSSISLKSGNEIQGVILSSDMSGVSVGNLKVRNVSITGGNAVAVKLNGGGVLDCIFQSVSASGGTGGIAINDATGSFQVTGIGTTAGSGGTIQNILSGWVGASFISCTNISLKNMNLTNAGVFGIKIDNVNNFALSNSILSGCGNDIESSETGGIYALNLKGTSTITNTNVNDSWGRGFYAYNDNGSSNITITGSQFKNAFNKSNGGSNFVFEGYGTSNNTLVLKTNDFSNAKDYGLTLNFGGNSTNTIQVGGNTLADGNTINAAASTPGSNGFSLQSNGSAVVNYNIFNNTIKSSFNGSFTCNVGSQDNAVMNGRINFNTINGGGVSSVSNGISVAAYGNSKHISEILNNTITNANNYGIVSEANDNNSATANARMDATIKNNNISLVPSSYAHVAVISIGSATSSLISAANIGGNTTNNAVNLGTATFDVVASGTGNKVLLQGATAFVPATGSQTTALTTFWNANNVAPATTALDEQGGGTILAGTVLTPANASASKFAVPKTTEETTPVVAENQNTPTSNNQTAKNSSAKATASTITVGSFTLPAGKSAIITFSATINAAATLPANTCAVTNQVSVSGTNFATVNSNITTTSIKPASATFTNSTENIPCLGSTAVTLNATCPLGTTATWYTTLAGGASFATGSSVNATPTANNTTYCVACEAAYCASDRLLVKTVTGTPSTSSAPETVVACDNYKWTVNGTTYAASGTYTAVVGCDTKTLNLTITPSTSSAPETITACDSYIWPVNGTTYNTSGTKTAVIGCDTKTLNLTITPSTSSTETKAVCDTYTWAVDGNTYTTSGTYNYTLGCDTKTLVLTVTPSTSSTENKSVCDSYTWPVNGNTYTTSGTYDYKVGCDTKTLVLTITPSTSSTETKSACGSYTWPVDGNTYTTSGTYDYEVGCDTKTLVLNITPSTSSTETKSVCDSYTWPIDGNTYTTSGTYDYKVGCDTKTLVLTITPSTSSTETVTACDSYTWLENNNNYTTSGTYSYSIGCDIKTLVLTITPSTSSTETKSVCGSYTWPIDGNTYTTSGTYDYEVGCDTKTLVLTITPLTSSTETITACDSYTWAEDGTTYTASGNYNYSVGCSTKTLVLTINNPSAIARSVSLNSGILTADQSGAVYKWYLCPNTLLTNETSQSFTPANVGDYKVEIIVGGCSVTSNCITITTLGTDQFNANDFKIYPNPSKGIINIVTPYKGNYNIVDQTGKIVKSVNLEESIINTINLENVSDGIYIIKNTSNNKVKAKKIIIKK
ncbi:Ig-like domain-containing protein [Flavobacterium sp.]|uniref:Ig-like domain-containing protein n=1 Tax=Flavobacterium sp. TaxID=239 RepID=UPI00374D9236